jgi:hypothetical protein
MDVKVRFQRVDVDSFFFSTIPSDLIPVKGDFIFKEGFHYEVTGRKYFFVETDDDEYILDKRDYKMIIYIKPTDFKNFTKTIEMGKMFFDKN